MKWTEKQQQVIDSRSGNLLVSAAAGSGKTAVLVERILEMVMGETSDGSPVGERMDIDELLVVTFTRAAAAQMKEKVARALEQQAEERPYDEHLIKQLALIHRAEITTIDSFCLGLVKENFNLLGMDASFDIADDAEMELMKSDVMDELLEECYREETPEFFALIDSFVRKESDESIVSLIQRIYRVASGFPKPEVWIEKAKAALQMKTKEQLESAGWYQAYREHVMKILQSAKVLASQCLEICYSSNGPAGYAKAIEADLDLIDRFYHTKNLDALRQEEMKFATLGRNKAGSFDEELQLLVKNTRDRYKTRIKEIKKELVSSEEILSEISLMEQPLRTALHLTQKYMQKLKTVKREKNLYEFRDIEEFALDVVCQGYDEAGHAVPSEMGKTIGRKYREILIDEYQDSNFLQEDILQCISGHGTGCKNIFMVGDIKQSIYKFRMARPDLFLEKYHTYTEEISDARKIVLSNNFRSSKTILSIVNAIFAPLMDADLGGISYDAEAALQPAPDVNRDVQPDRAEISDAKAAANAEKTALAEKKGEILLIENDVKETEGAPGSFEVEAAAIANKINEIVNGDQPMMIKESVDSDGKPVYRKAAYRDIVILVRGVKKAAMAFDEVFEKAQIPLFIESENGYFDAVEVQTILSMLAIIDNAYLDYELAAVLRSPLVGLNEVELAQIVGIYNRDYMLQDQPDHRKLRSVYLYEKIQYYVNNYQEEVPEKLTQFLQMLSDLKQQKNYMTIHEMIHYILKETGYYWYVGAMQMGKRRQANLDMLIYKADAYENGSFKGLFHFLRYVERLKVHEIDFAEANIFGEQENAVRVMTMHKSKGLEFPIVFVSHLGKRLQNLDAKESVVIHSDYYLASPAVDCNLRVKKNTFVRKAILQAGSLEMYAEEMRILYVALTRAKEKLFMTACVDQIDKLEEKLLFIWSKDQKLSYIDKLDASSFIQWILMALRRWQQQADALTFSTIRASEALAVMEQASKEIKQVVRLDTLISDIDVYHKVKENLSWTYPYAKQQPVKSKMSITEIKKLQNQGEENPGEIVYGTSFEAETEEIPKLAIMQTDSDVQGNEVGTVMHKLMELMDFNRCSREEVKAQVDSMFERNIVDPRFRPFVSCEKIYTMLNSELGRSMAKADACGKLYKEQQFYIAMKPEKVLPDYKEQTDESIVVQGIIDAYFIEDDQVYLMDYKTDQVSSLDVLVNRYRIQLDKYAETIERITGYPVVGKCIYSFHLNDFIWFS